MAEYWKDIPNFNGYQVSNEGKIRTHNKITYCKKHGERHWKDRILKFKNITETASKTGYRVDLWKDNKPHSFLVARLVAFTFFGEDINNRNLTVNHKDGNRLNNHLDNLELISLADNIRHGFRTGLYSNQKSCKLIDKNKKEYCFRSLSQASMFLGQNHGYISNRLKRKSNIAYDRNKKKYYVEVEK